MVTIDLASFRVLSPRKWLCTFKNHLLARLPSFLPDKSSFIENLLLCKTHKALQHLEGAECRIEL
jgi:hypothetical protein